MALAHAAVAEASREPIRRVLYPTSDVGLHTPEQARTMALLSTVTDDVRRAAVYATGPAPGLRERALALPRDVGLVFFSPSAVDAFLDAVIPEVSERALALCLGDSTARAWDSRAPSHALRIARADALPDAILSLTRGRALPPPEGR